MSIHPLSSVKLFFPLELSCMIAENLDDDSIGNAALVSRQWYDAVVGFKSLSRRDAFRHLQPILQEVCDAIAKCCKISKKILVKFSQNPTEYIKNTACYRIEQIAEEEKKCLEEFLCNATEKALESLEDSLKEDTPFADLPITLIIKKKLKLQRPLERLFNLVQKRVTKRLCHPVSPLSKGTIFSIVKLCPYHGFFLLKLISYYNNFNDFPLQMIKDIDKDHEAKPFGDDILTATVHTRRGVGGAYVNHAIAIFLPDRSNRKQDYLRTPNEGPFLGSLLLNRKYNTQAFSIYLWLCTFSREENKKFLNFSYRVYVKVCQIIHDHHSSFGFFPEKPELSSKCLDFYKHMAEKKLHALEKKQKKIEPAPSGEPLFIGCGDAEPEVITELVQKRLAAERGNPIDKDEIVKKLNQEFITLAKQYRNESKFEDLLKLMKFLNYSDQKDFLKLFNYILALYGRISQVVVKLIQKINNFHRMRLIANGFLHPTKIYFISVYLTHTLNEDLKSQLDFLKEFELTKYERFDIARRMLETISGGQSERLAKKLPLVMALMGVSPLPSEAQLPSPEAGEGKGESMEVDDECEKKYY